MQKHIKRMIAVLAFATATHLAPGATPPSDLTLRLTKVDGHVLQWDASSKPNGLQTHRFIFIGPETPTPSKHIVPLNTAAEYISATATQPVGFPTFTGGSGSGSGGGGGKLRLPDGGTVLSREVTNEYGANYVRTVTSNIDGSISMSLEPEANGVLADQEVKPMAPIIGNLRVTVKEVGGTNNNNWAGYNVLVPFMNVSSAISVNHYSDTNVYSVSSFQVTVGGATLSCNGTSLHIFIDWFKAAKDG